MVLVTYKFIFPNSRMSSLNTRKERGRIYTHKNKKTIHNTKRSKSLEPVTNNSEEIGAGGFGIVSRPPARCDSFLNKNFNQNAWRAAYYGNPNYISKLTEYSSAERELEVGIAIKDVIPNYENFFCLVEFICNAPESKSINRNGDYYNTYAISPYCGTPLDKYMRYDNIAPVNIFELCNLVPSIQYMTGGLIKLHLNHIYHKDIHGENILYDSDSGLCRLIDFGLADDLRHIKSHNSPVIIGQEHHDLDMLVKNIIIPLIEYLLDSRINESKIHIKYPYVEDFYYQLREFHGQAYSIMNPPKKNAFKEVDIEEQLTRLINVVYYFRKLKSLDQIIDENYSRVNNNNNK